VLLDAIEQASRNESTDPLPQRVVESAIAEGWADPSKLFKLAARGRWAEDIEEAHAAGAELEAAAAEYQQVVDARPVDMTPFLEPNPVGRPSPFEKVPPRPARGYVPSSMGEDPVTERIARLEPRLLAASDMCDAAYQRLRDAGLEGDDQATARAATAWEKSNRTYDSILSDLTEAKRQRRMEHQRAELESKWDLEQHELFQELLDVYGNHGPQYRLILGRLVAVEMQLRRLADLGALEGDKMFLDLTDHHVRLVNQLQKYTESTKQQVDHDGAVEDAIRATLLLIEGVVAPAHPTLWLDVVRTVEGAAHRGDNGTTIIDLPPGAYPEIGTPKTLEAVKSTPDGAPDADE
jgi:hypothetical protein